MAARKLQVYIYSTILFCCLSIIICGVSLGTKNWFSSEANNGKGINGGPAVQTTVNYGLFSGKKIVETSLNQKETKNDLQIVCLPSEAICMFSCGVNKEARENILRDLHKKGETAIQCSVSDDTLRLRLDDNDSTLEDTTTEESTPGEVKVKFLSFGLWLSTLIFLFIGMIFSAVGIVLALYNTYRSPFQPILSVMGLYVWNSIAAGCILLALIIYGATFASSLKDNAAIRETLLTKSTQHLSSEGNGSLGFSYWILILAFFFNAANVGILKYRSWKINQVNRVTDVFIEDEDKTGENILF